MIRDEKIWIANTENGENISIIPKMANRHGLVAGATGTGKTVTLKVMAESFSDMGVPVFMADVKGDIAGMMNPGTDSEDMQKRIAKFGLAEAGFEYKGYPVTLWDIFGKSGIPLRTTISEMGPLLLSRILGLNDLQSDILSIIFKIADDNNLLLIDTKDLKSMLAYVDDHSSDLAADYGKISSASIGVITRAIVSLETEGGDIFFGEPALNISDWLQIGAGGKGMINVLASDSLISNGKLYSTFLLWLLSELFETLPEVGDMSKPKMVFFFDEAHLLFNDTPKVLLEKIEQVVKLIRSKGVGVYFCTQNTRDIPDGVLAQLSNKVQHGLRAYTPSDQKAVRAAADSFRVNPDFDTFDTILNLGTGEAVVSFLQEDGVPSIATKVNILPPQCSMSAAADSQREQCVKESLLYSKYANEVDPDSAYEFLQRKGLEEQAEKEAKQQAEREEKEAQKRAEQEEKEAKKKAEQEEKEKQKAKERAEKEAQKKEEKEKKAKQQAMKTVGNSVVGTVGRELGKNIGGKYGKFGKTLGGNVGASLGRGLLSTLFKK
ncbi:MAG: DUF853 family protein [Lachnospiraceae bacterium]|nr:DUF853 family protein [Lachnospiraceae bacterium]